MVIGETPDDILGIVLKDELLIALLECKGNSLVKEFVHQPLFVDEDITAEALLSTFQRTRRHLGIVGDEYGGVSGVVSLEDVLEVLTGEIVDETDRTIDLREDARKRKDKSR